MERRFPCILGETRYERWCFSFLEMDTMRRNMFRILLQRDKLIRLKKIIRIEY